MGKGELPDVTPEYFQILVVRELRKAGLDVGDPIVHRRSELRERERGFVLELVLDLSRPDWRRRALVACRRQEQPVLVEVITEVSSALAPARAGIGMVFSTADFTAEALRAGRQAGLALLRVVDGRLAFDSSGWGPTGHYPAWLPAYLTQVVDQDSAGRVRYRLLEPGRPEMLLDQFRQPPDDTHTRA